MPDFPSPEDEAAQYVFGELDAAGRRDFESRLAQSSELRDLVRGLEEGLIATSLTSPRRRPPPRVWQQIEKSVKADSRPAMATLPFWLAWWRNGWAVAAACLTGWVLYALWVNHPAPAETSTAANQAGAHPPAGASPIESTAPVRGGPALQSGSLDVLVAAQQLLQARTREIAALRDQVAQLESQLELASQTSSQQQARLGESSRLKFLQLVSGSNSPGAAAPRLSPEMQHALFVAMARELGWPTASDTNAAHNPAALTAPGGFVAVTPTNHDGVDFADLRPASSTVTNQPNLQAAAPTNFVDSGPPPASAGTTNIMIPAFVSGENLVVAVDPSLAEPGSQLTFSTGLPNQWPQLLGSVIMGSNPLVVTMPGNYYSTGILSSPSGATLTITSITASGHATNVLLFAPPGPIQP